MSASRPDTPPLRARPVRFDWSNTPLHWVPGDAFATHVVNGLHLIAPVAERWFIKVYKEALPRIKDERLKADMRGFMGQEGMHANAHDAVLAQLAAQGIDTTDFIALYEKVCATVAGEPPWLPLPAEAWFQWRMSMVAAGEQMTCVLGDWILDANGLDAAGADPVMIELLRWHGAEEVEHRSVAFDVLKHFAGDHEYPLRVAGMAVVFPMLFILWTHGVRELLNHDPTLADHNHTPLEYLRLVQEGKAPGLELVLAALRYLDPAFHPSREGSLERAAEFLAKSVHTGLNDPR